MLAEPLEPELFEPLSCGQLSPLSFPLCEPEPEDWPCDGLGETVPLDCADAVLIPIPPIASALAAIAVAMTVRRILDVICITSFAVVTTKATRVT